MTVIFPIGVPAVLWWTLWRHRHALYPRNKHRVLLVTRSVEGQGSTVITVRSVNLLPALREVLHDKVSAADAPACATIRSALVAAYLQFCRS